MKKFIRLFKINTKAFKSAVIAALVFCLIMSVAVLAKFIADRNVAAQIFDRNVATYYMEIVGNDGITKLSERIIVDEMNPGETYEVDFYISNGNATEISQVSLDYEIEVIHTMNMPLVYELYDEEGRLLNGVSEEDGYNIYENDGSRTVYTEGADSQKMVLNINKDNPNAITQNKYTLKIIWEMDEESSDYKYVKEIDFLYVNVYAYESKPVAE